MIDISFEFDRDYKKHNEEVEKVWSYFNEKKPVRMPVILGINSRIIMLDAKLNLNGYTYDMFFDNPDVMTEMLCECEYQVRHNIYADHEMGMPDKGWSLTVERQNLNEAGWLGADIKYVKNNVPFCVPFLDDDNKYEILKKPFPGLFDNFEQKSLRVYERMQKLQKSGWTYKGVPIGKVQYGGMGTDGPVTLACMIRGTENFCSDLIEDPVYANELMAYLSESAVYRIKGLRKHFGFPETNDGYGLADDSIALLSCEMYQQLVYPHHRKIIESLVTDFTTSINSIHLCGDAQRHFDFIKENLRVYSFDTGYPIDFVKLAKMGDDMVRLLGGVKVDDLVSRSCEWIENETKRIMDLVMVHTDRFIMREANNLSPCTPFENIYAMYQTVRKYGRY